MSKRTKRKVSFQLEDIELSMNNLSPIAVEVERDSSSLNSTLDDQPDPTRDHMDDLDQHMDEEERKIHRKWDVNVQRISNQSVEIRPTKSPAEPSLSVMMSRENTSTPIPAASNHATLNGNAIPSPVCSIPLPHSPKRALNGVAKSALRNSLSELSTRSVDHTDDRRTSPHYVISPTTGEKSFHMEFDTEGYTAERIRISIRGQRLVIKATQNEISDGRNSVSEFCRRVKIPNDVDIAKLSCWHDPDRDKIIADAPLIRFNGFFASPMSSVRSSRDNIATAHHSFLDTSFPPPQHLNVPHLRKKSNSETVMEMDAELGRVFKAEDVTVKVLGDKKLRIHASRQEDNSDNTLKAEVSREFHLKDAIVPGSLKADFGNDGVLRISAQLRADDRGVVNGDTSGVHVEIVNGSQ